MRELVRRTAALRIYHSEPKMIQRRTVITMNVRSPLMLACAGVLVCCSVSQDQEVELGQENAAQINAQLPIVHDAAVVSYIQSLGESIASKTSRSDLDWHFYVVNTRQINAFALPGGFVYVDRGLIESTDRLDELTGTLGPENGHRVERHA